MKKFLSVVLVVMMLASLSVCAFADVVPSIEGKDVPAYDAEGIEVDGVDEGVEIIVVLTGFNDDPGEDASEEEKTAFNFKKDAMKKAIEIVTDQNALVDAVKNAVKVESSREPATDVIDTSEDAIPIASNVFYVEAFYVADYSPAFAFDYVEGENPTVKARVKFELPKHLMKVLQLIGDTWIEVPVVLNDKGEPCLEFCFAGPVIFVVNANAENG